MEGRSCRWRIGDGKLELDSWCRRTGEVRQELVN